MNTKVRTAALLIPLLLVACRTGHSADGGTRSDSGVTSRDGAIVLSGRALSDRRGSALDAMRGRVPNFKVRRTGRGQCPEINIRSHQSFQGSIKPKVYVDRTLSSDTCILESLRSENIESIEVYPQGFTRRSGYATHAHGLILVFMRGRQ